MRTSEKAVNPKFAEFVRQERVGVLPNFLEAARTEKLEARYILALTTGMMQGELLGHSTIAITLDTYSHVLPGMGDSLADTMDEAFG